MKNIAKRVISVFLSALFVVGTFCAIPSAVGASERTEYYKAGVEYGKLLKSDSRLLIAKDGDNLYAVGIREKTSVSDAFSDFDGKATFFEANGSAASDDAVVKTGDKISVASGDGASTALSAVVNGDADGSGDIATTDYIYVKRHVLKINLLTGAALLSTDVDNDGNTDSSDLILLKRHLLGIKRIGSAVIQPGDTVKVPDVTGFTEKKAKETLEAYGLTPISVPHTGSASDKGMVLTQSFAPGFEVSAGTTVSISVSNGMAPKDSALVPMTDPLVKNRKTLKEGANSDYVPVNYDNVKAIWLSQLDLCQDYADGDDYSTYWAGKAVYYDGKAKHQTYQNEFTDYIKTIMKNIKDSGFNTVMVQVHPDSDSMYPSALYPWSDYMLAGYGSVSGYDLLQIMLDEAHAQGLSFHAWINPMRCMTETEIQKVNISYPIRQWYEDETKKNTDLFKSGSRLYLNPAYEEVRKYIIDVAAEIVRYYDVDAIHMDDYFYPDAKTTYDETAFKSQSEFKTVNQFRIHNIDLMVKGMYEAIKRENPKVLYGISPRGSVEQSKNELGADVEKWVSNDGYVDYIVPQIYFGFLHKTSAFDKMTDMWAKITTSKTVKLIIGIGIYKQNKYDTYAGTDEAKNEWKTYDDIAKREIEYLDGKRNTNGFCIFSYQYIFNMSSGELNPNNKPESNNFLPVIPTVFND